MKKIIMLSVAGILSLAMLAACNKKEENNDLLMLLGLAGGSSAGAFTKTVALSSGETGGNLPFNDNYPFYHFQLLYRAGDINGSGNISSIFFRYNASIDDPGVTCSNVTIKLGHTSLNELGDLGTDMGLNINQGMGSAVTVLDNATVTIPAGESQEYFEIPLAIPFNYNGVDNLVVDIVRTTACSGDVSMRVGNDGATLYNRAAISQDAANPNEPNTVREFLHHTKFKFAGGDNVAVVADNTDLSYFSPFCPYSDNLKVQQLYLASEINGSGPITGIAIPIAVAATAAETYTITVKLGHTDRNELATAFTDNFNVGSPVTVANGAAFNVPAGIPAGAYVWFPLPDKTFSYNGRDNLVVEIQSATPETETLDMQTVIVANRRLYGSLTASTGNYSARITGIKFRFAGATMNVITVGDVLEDHPFDTAANTIQYLYHAADLGTDAKIYKVAFRLTDDSVLSNYSDFKLVLGHATGSELGSTFSLNMTDARTMYNGTFSVSDALKSGDWIEIPLSGSFAYDATKNLVVEMSASVGTGDNGIRMEHNSIRYENRRAHAHTNATDTATVVNSYNADLMLFVK